MNAWPFGDLRPLAFGAIVADPPWSYEMRSEKGYEKSPEAHYETMSEAEISALPVGHLAAGDCLLILWSTWPHLPQALRVMSAWGFRFVTGGSWHKTTASGATCMGTGYVLRSASEPYLVGAIGKPRIVSRGERNVLVTADADAIPSHLDGIRREHSRKPPDMRAMVERLLPHAYAAELFAREPWPGHAVWGAETAKFGWVP